MRCVLRSGDGLTGPLSTILATTSPHVLHGWVPDAILLLTVPPLPMMRWSFLPLFLAGFLLPFTAHAQAWTQPRGEAYVKVSHGRSTAAEQYDFEGAVLPYADNVDGDAFFDRSLYLYGEYGLSDSFTLVALLPYKRLTVEDAAFEYTTGGIGSIMVGGRYNLKPLVGGAGTPQTLAVNAMFTLPAGYTRNFAPSIGPGQVDVQASLNYGVSLFPLPAYAQVGAGYRVRTDAFGLSGSTECQPGRDVNCVVDAQPAYDNEWLVNAEIGSTPQPWILVQGLLQGVFSANAPTAQTSFTASNPIATRQRFLKLGGGVTLYPIPQIGLSVQGFATPYGRNTIRSTDWFFGVEYLLR